MNQTNSSSIQSPRNNPMAVFSLVAGILGLTFFPVVGSVVALITGYMARKEINENPETMTGKDLATAGIVLGWIGTILAILSFVLVLIAIVLFVLFLVPVSTGSIQIGSFLLPWFYFFL